MLYCVSYNLFWELQVEELQLKYKSKQVKYFFSDECK